jgi:hypothetical protein
LRGESKDKEPRRVHTYILHQIPKSKVPKTHQEIHQERVPKITTKNKERVPKSTTKNNRGQHNKTLRNHAESSIHTKVVHTRSSLPPDHPTLSQDLPMKLSSKSIRNPKKIGRENRKTNELWFQLPSSHHLGYMEASRESKMPLLAN